MKRIAVLVALAVILSGFFLSDISDTTASTANTSIPDDEVASNVSGANNSSGSATITITMRTASTEGD